jgi:phenylacetate-CoA ligase
MGDLNATRVGLNMWVKSVVGLPYRQRARRAWAMTEAEYWSTQVKRFSAIYGFARARVPWYRERRNAYPAFTGRSRADLLGFLSKLPVLRKASVRERNEDFWPVPRLPFTRIHTTSGTSGTPLRLASTVGEKAFFRAIRESWHLRICGERAPRTLILSGFLAPAADSRETFWFDHFSGNAYLSIYSLNEANRAQIVDGLDAFRPRMVSGYASAIHELAVLLGERPPGMAGTVAAIVSSEVLQPHWRPEIEQAVCDRVYDFYSSQEGCHAAMECVEGRLHVHPLVGIVEVVDEAGGAVAPGEAGEILVTGLLRRAMPLIRFDLGDTVLSASGPGCSCGLSWPMIGAVDGRSEDLVRTRDGSHVGYLCFHATKNLRGIRECQLVQRDFERFVCNIVLGPEQGITTSTIEECIRTQISSRLQVPVEIEYRYLPAIPRGARGKFKAVVVEMGSAPGAVSRAPGSHV